MDVKAHKRSRWLRQLLLGTVLSGWGLAAAASTWSADGWNANRIEYARGGRLIGEFRQSGEGWVELRGGREYRFEESGRDDHNVWLYDSARDLRIQLDLQARQVWYTERGGPRQRLYDMWSAYGGDGGGQRGPVGGGRFACASAIQDQIAWDYQGNTHWEPGNIRDLCAGAGDSIEPARCFETVMHGGVNWGEGRNWEWVNAIALCAGTRDARATVGCFRQQVREGYHWEDAIRECGAR